MKVVIALDSFKGCLSSREASEAVALGVMRAEPEAVVDVIPIADGGEGTATILRDALHGHEVSVAGGVDALGRPTSSSYVRLPDREHTAIIEAARTIGLTLVLPVADSTARESSSYGLGAQIATAIRDGSRKVWIALGGTATTDGGIGLLQALGAVLPGASGRLSPGAGNRLLTDVPHEISKLPSLDGVELTVLVDVQAPMTGERGAVKLFAPQKGASREQVNVLEANMSVWAQLLEETCGHGIAKHPGSGAAGGCAGALLALGARIEEGFSHVAGLVGLREAIAAADLVITGEGRIDTQTSLGKAAWGVANLARSCGVPVVALGGSVDPVTRLDAAMFEGVFCIQTGPKTDHEAMAPGVARQGLAFTAENVTRLFARASSP